MRSVQEGGTINITVYLPNALGARAKEAGLPLSRLLREAVERELVKVAEIDRIASAWPYSPTSNQEDGYSERKSELDMPGAEMGWRGAPGQDTTFKR